MKGIMIQGTASDVGKSLLATAFCRLLSNEGVKVAPFKSQNMSQHPFVLQSGAEIGRSQAIQAVAARTEPSIWMNPILMKPSTRQRSEIVLYGKKQERAVGADFRHSFYEKGQEMINRSLQKLSEKYDVLVIEGAGSPVEMNLKEEELANMKVAELAHVPVILVATIDRGGLFASIIGTLELLTRAERSRVQGIIVNKFRGNPSLFADGVRWLEEKTELPVLGVIPHIDHRIETIDQASPVFDQLAQEVKEHLYWQQVKQLITRWPTA